MKFKDPITGEYKTLYLKTGDTLPVGTIVSFDGDEIPEGYEEVIGEEARVVISPTEPTTGEEVWIQKGKNLINPNALKGAYINDLNGIITTQNGCVATDYIEVKSGKDYFISSKKTAGNWGAWYDKNKIFISGFTLGGNYSGVVTAPSNAKYMCYTINYQDKNPDYLNNAMIAQSSEEIDYEPYIDKKIYTKNDNGVYEGFYDETNREVYSTSEQRIGTWIDGKPVYRKVISMGALPNTATKTVKHNLSNLDKITKISGFATEPSSGSTLTLPYIDVGNLSWGIQCYVDSQYIIINCGDNKSRYSESYIIIEYTKTTD